MPYYQFLTKCCGWLVLSAIILWSVEPESALGQSDDNQSVLDRNDAFNVVQKTSDSPAPSATTDAPDRSLPESRFEPLPANLPGEDFFSPNSLNGLAQGDPDPGNFRRNSTDFGVGSNFFESDPDFTKGLVVRRPDVALKIGGYVKADLIYDFNAIDSTDAFDVTTIPVGAPKRTNSRIHARQTRLNADTRWQGRGQPIRLFVEGDFFSVNNQFRLRHAYGEIGGLTVGQTWTTFTDVSAAPATLDFEGSVAAVNTRRAQVRWTQEIFNEHWEWSVALEDSETIFDVPEDLFARTVKLTPDFVTRVRWSQQQLQMQIAAVVRQLGAQLNNGDISERIAGGANFTSVFAFNDTDKFYYEIVYGNGIGSFRGIPDVGLRADGAAELLGSFAWMVGFTHEWRKNLSSNFTFAENHLRSSGGQTSDELNNVTYLASNLIWSPYERVDIGVEYLYGKRENIGGASGVANRIQVAFVFYLP